MERLLLQEDLMVIGYPVKEFPQGISTTFDSLMQALPEENNREYYGISYVEDSRVHYYAMAPEATVGEAEKHHCDRYIIEKGEYTFITINNWQEKTALIKNVFHELMRGACPDYSRPCIEWYKNDTQMICMVRVPPT